MGMDDDPIKRRATGHLMGVEMTLFVVAWLIGGLAWTLRWPAPIMAAVLVLFAIDGVLLAILIRRLIRLRRAQRVGS